MKNIDFWLLIDMAKICKKIFQTGKKCFSDRVTFNLALKIIDVLEYIHSKGYVHNDIKAQNLLLGYGRTKENDVYLVDMGLVSKYQKEGVHYEYKPDARKAHDGTIEYTSRDAHIGNVKHSNPIVK
jgi:vaccinia related kinase